MIRWIGEPLPKPVFTEVTDPVHVKEAQEQLAQFRRNVDWCQAHREELVPPNYGKYLAVAGQEAFLADTQDAALALATAAHPEDRGVALWHLIPWRGPRV
jgi:hypothetical protein